ncbi:MAG: potassium channel family protein, partial [Bacteroidota bacterium]
MAKQANRLFFQTEAHVSWRRFNRLLWLVILLTSSMVIGMGGFILIEGYTMVEAFYMSVITISTVGFTEVQPLSSTGRLFTGFYIILNLGIFAYVVSVLTAYLFEGELNRMYRQYLSRRVLRKMKDHTIVCGLGRNGFKACEELLHSGEKFVVIDNNALSLERYPQAKEFQVIIGDATHDEVLEKAGIHQARALITTLPSDADNVFITLSAREENPDVFVIARASEEKSESKLKHAGAHEVVMPDALGGLHMAQLVTKPHVIEFLNLLNGIGEESQNIELEEVQFEDLIPAFQNKSIRDLDVRNQTGATIIGFKDDQRGFLFNPSADT